MGKSKTDRGNLDNQDSGDTESPIEEGNPVYGGFTNESGDNQNNASSGDNNKSVSSDKKKAKGEIDLTEIAEGEELITLYNPTKNPIHQEITHAKALVIDPFKTGQINYKFLKIPAIKRLIENRKAIIVKEESK